MSPKVKLEADVLSTHGDKRKLPELKLSYESVLQNNQKVKAEGQMSPKDKLDPDVLSTLGDKRKLPWPEPKSVLQNNQKIKTERHIGKVSRIESVTGVDQKKMDLSCTSSEAWHVSSKSSDLAKEKISPIQGETEMRRANCEADIHVIDLEECDSVSR